MQVNSANQKNRTPNKSQNIRVSSEPKEQRANKFLILDNEHVSQRAAKSNEAKHQFITSYQGNLDFVMDKNPEYFKHVAGKCVCFKTCKQRRCQGNDQNQYKLAMPFASTYSADFVGFKSVNLKELKDAEIKANSHYSQYYEQGANDQIQIKKESVAQFDFSDKIFSKLQFSPKRKLLDKELCDPLLTQKTQYKTQYK